LSLAGADPAPIFLVGIQGAMSYGPRDRNVVGGRILCVFVLLGFAPALALSDAGRSVRRTGVPGGLRVSYSWNDPRGVARTIEASVDEAALADSELALGFTCDELRAFLMEAEARIRAERGLSAVDIARKVVASKSDGDWVRVGENVASDFQFVLRTEGSGDPGRAAEIDEIIRTSQKAWESSRKTIEKRLEKEMDAFLSSRGMMRTAGGIAVDYRRLVRENRGRLAALSAKFKKVCGADKRSLLEAVLSFVQGIPSRPRPAAENGRYTAGLAVPLRVLADDSGDCDSKAVLFASLWTALCRYRTILITVKEHMLVGVAVPFAEGTAVEFDGLRYALLEVNCGGSLLPGEITSYSLALVDRGLFKYRIVS